MAAATYTATSGFPYIGFSAPFIWLLSLSTPVAKLALHVSARSQLPCKFIRQSLSFLTSLTVFPYYPFRALFLHVHSLLSCSIMLSCLQEMFIRRYTLPVPFTSTLHGPSLDNQEYGRMDPLCWPHNTLYLQTLALTSPTKLRSLGRYCSLTDRGHGVCYFVCTLHGQKFGSADK
jgi:hypothetical protein